MRTGVTAYFADKGGSLLCGQGRRLPYRQGVRPTLLKGLTACLADIQNARSEAVDGVRLPPEWQGIAARHFAKEFMVTLRTACSGIE